jgi:ubiquinone/menaquinone biosynthesis C-methylase UbiE
MARVKSLLKMFKGKQDKELTFQKQWKQFPWPEVLGKLREYWSSYRYIHEILECIELDESKRVLDVGCGVVSVLNILPGIRYGIDPLVDQYKKLYPLDKNITWKKNHGEKISFEDSFFDVVFCSNVLDHTENPKVVMSEMRRVLKTNGKLVLTIDIFSDKRTRDLAHPHSLQNKDVDVLLSNGWNIMLDRMSTINAQVYNLVIDSIADSDYKERVIVAEKN